MLRGWTRHCWSITGLHTDLKRKLIGTEGSLDELVLKARFKEDKSRELSVERTRTQGAPQTQRPTGRTRTTSVTPNVTEPPVTSAPTQISDTTPSTGTTVTTGTPGSRARWYNCGVEGHMARTCPYKKKGRRDDEAHPPLTGDSPRSFVYFDQRRWRGWKRNDGHPERMGCRRPCTKLCLRPLSKLALWFSDRPCNIPEANGGCANWPGLGSVSCLRWTTFLYLGRPWRNTTAT